MFPIHNEGFLSRDPRTGLLFIQLERLGVGAVVVSNDGFADAGRSTALEDVSFFRTRRRGGSGGLEGGIGIGGVGVYDGSYPGRKE